MELDAAAKIYRPNSALADLGRSFSAFRIFCAYHGTMASHDLADWWTNEIFLWIHNMMTCLVSSDAIY